MSFLLPLNTTSELFKKTMMMRRKETTLMVTTSPRRAKRAARRDLPQLQVAKTASKSASSSERNNRYRIITSEFN